MARHIVKGDSVIVTAGNDRGRVGEILRVLPDQGRVVVQGVNVRTKHVRAREGRPGGSIQAEMPIHISNVSPVIDGKPTRVRFVENNDGSKDRVAARSGEILHTLRKPGRA